MDFASNKSRSYISFKATHKDLNVIFLLYWNHINHKNITPHNFFFFCFSLAVSLSVFLSITFLSIQKFEFSFLFHFSFTYLLILNELIFIPPHTFLFITNIKIHSIRNQPSCSKHCSLNEFISQGNAMYILVHVKSICANLLEKWVKLLQHINSSTFFFFSFFANYGRAFLLLLLFFFILFLQIMAEVLKM